MEDIPPELIFNWDQTGISLVPGSSWTMELKGSKRVEIAGSGDKRQITALLCGTMAGEFLPPQLIYQGKTSACLPKHKFPSNWHITCTPNHWSNENKMIEYINLIFIPYVEQKRKELELSKNQAALALFCGDKCGKHSLNQLYLARVRCGSTLPNLFDIQQCSKI